MMDYSFLYQGLLGLFVFMGIAWVLSENKQDVSFRGALLGVVAQFIFACVILKVPAVKGVFISIGEGINQLRVATCEGTRFVFGYLGGGDCPFDPKPGRSLFIFAFQALPMIIVISALSMLLFYWKILPIVVRGFSWALRRTLNIGGALGVCAAAKVFLGQTDAPLLIRPYLAKLTKSELFSVMTAGMATTSATAMVLYASILEGVMSDPLTHILTASIISIPGALVISRLMIPEVEKETDGAMEMPYQFSGSMDALAKGTQDGLQLYLSIIAMVIVALAVVKLINSCLGVFPDIWGEPLSLERIFGLVMAPFAWLMGIPFEEAKTAGALLGTKTVLNEFIAFFKMKEVSEGALSESSRVIMTYALCGFANLSSIGIQIGGLGVMAPSRREDIIALGFRALLAGTLASCMSATVVGLLMKIG